MNGQLHVPAVSPSQKESLSVGRVGAGATSQKIVICVLLSTDKRKKIFLPLRTIPGPLCTPIVAHAPLRSSTLAKARTLQTEPVLITIAPTDAELKAIHLCPTKWDTDVTFYFLGLFAAGPSRFHGQGHYSPRRDLILFSPFGWSGISSS
jgi:hypothetical protein